MTDVFIKSNNAQVSVTYRKLSLMAEVMKLCQNHSQDHLDWFRLEKSEQNRSRTATDEMSTF